MKMVGLFNLADIAFAKFSSMIGGKKYSTITEDGEKDYWKNRENRWRFVFKVIIPAQMAVFFITVWYFKLTNNFFPMICSAYLCVTSCFFGFIAMRILMKFEKIEAQGKIPEMKNIHIVLIFGIPLAVLCAYLIQMVVS